MIAHNVVIEDRIPKGSELLGTSPRAELVGKRLIWNEPALKPNEEKKISIKVVPKQEGPIGSVARVYFAKGDLDNAVKQQSKAVELEPHSGLIRRQLDFFRKQRDAKK